MKKWTRWHWYKDDVWYGFWPKKGPSWFPYETWYWAFWEIHVPVN